MRRCLFKDPQSLLKGSKRGSRNSCFAKQCGHTRLHFTSSPNRHCKGYCYCVSLHDFGFPVWFPLESWQSPRAAPPKGDIAVVWVPSCSWACLLHRKGSRKDGFLAAVLPRPPHKSASSVGAQSFLQARGTPESFLQARGTPEAMPQGHLSHYPACVLIA